MFKVTQGQAVKAAFKPTSICLFLLYVLSSRQLRAPPSIHQKLKLSHMPWPAASRSIGTATVCRGAALYSTTNRKGCTYMVPCLLNTRSGGRVPLGRIDGYRADPQPPVHPTPPLPQQRQGGGPSDLWPELHPHPSPSHTASSSRLARPVCLLNTLCPSVTHVHTHTYTQTTHSSLHAVRGRCLHQTSNSLGAETGVHAAFD